MTGRRSTGMPPRPLGAAASGAAASGAARSAPSDLLVRLYDLPAEDRAGLAAQGVVVRRALAPERHIVVDWVARTFVQAWASEAEVAYSNRPISCFVAVQRGEPVGFACYDATALAFFGPGGVAEAARGKGIGRALLLACLHAMRARGYGYAIVGAAGPIDFYVRTVGALVIPGSWPGIYDGMLTGTPPSSPSSPPAAPPEATS